MSPPRYHLPRFETLVASCRDENLLGVGSQAKVYCIDDCNTYVVKKPHALVYLSDYDNLPDTPVLIEDPALAMRNFGQPIASYKDSLILLRHQAGRACGVSPFLRHTVTDKKSLDRLYENSTERAACRSHQAYRSLVEDMAFLQTTQYDIDPSMAGNLLIDDQADRFGIVDLIPLSHAHTAPDELLVMLFDNSFTWHYTGTHKDRLIAQRRIILSKLLKASEESGLPFSQHTQPSSSVAYALTLAGYNEGSDERAQIEARMRYTRPNLAERPKAAAGENHKQALRCA